MTFRHDAPTERLRGETLYQKAKYGQSMVMESNKYTQKALADINNPVSRMVKEILLLPDESRLTALERLTQDKDPSTRARSLLAAHHLKDIDASKICLELLTDPIDFVRIRACEYAIEYHITDAAELIIEILEYDQNEDARASAAIAVESLAPKESIRYLEGLALRVTGGNHEGTPVRTLLLHSLKMIQIR